MTDAQYHRRCKLILTMAGEVVLSGYPNPIYDRYLSGWRRVTRRMRVYGRWTPKYASRPNKTEALWMNFDPGTVNPEGSTVHRATSREHGL
jgi:hypothetical protein